MFISVFDIFKIGIGPSSSHTMGPMLAAQRFLRELTAADLKPDRIEVRLYGSLAFTGKGHATDRAVLLGLLGFEPATLDNESAAAALDRLANSRRLELSKSHALKFEEPRDLVFDYGPALPGHPNGMKMRAEVGGNLLHEGTYYSIGGGFIASEADLGKIDSGEDQSKFPFNFSTAEMMLSMGRSSKLSIAEMKAANEKIQWGDELDSKLDHLWSIMDSVIEAGLTQSGTLPGGLRVKRRAQGIYEQLMLERTRNMTQPHVINDWLSVYAMAVNEENAAGGRVVTSPTNGAAGVVPAVIRYYRDHCLDAGQAGIRKFLLTAAAIGAIVKQNASISGAEVGCQGEVGSASSMAAAGLCAALGGTNEQVENAAEIALEHHLGMTCDPVAGLVQVPCIERNGLGAIKAVSAASLALRGDGTHFMPLDNCIEAMRQTGVDMSTKYKETSQGGLAVNLPEC
ncbi:MAG: L-serine ammonia-lyase [Alphaproteobacteria bacterium]